MPRIKFLEALASRLPKDMVQFNCRIQSLQDKDDHVELQFEDGRIEAADVVLGCDGLHSQVRQHVVGSGYGPSFSHSIICRGSASANDIDNLVGESLAKGSQVGIGNGDGFVLYPVDDTTVNLG